MDREVPARPWGMTMPDTENEPTVLSLALRAAKREGYQEGLEDAAKRGLHPEAIDSLLKHLNIRPDALHRSAVEEWYKYSVVEALHRLKASSQ